MKALLLLAAMASSSVSELPFEPTIHCDATLNSDPAQPSAQVICPIPVTYDEALRAVNQVAQKHGLGQYLSYVSASKGNTPISRVWQFLLVEM